MRGLRHIKPFPNSQKERLPLPKGKLLQNLFDCSGCAFMSHLCRQIRGCMGSRQIFNSLLFWGHPVLRS